LYQKLKNLKENQLNIKSVSPTNRSNKNLTETMKLVVPERAISSKITDLSLINKLKKKERSDSISYIKDLKETSSILSQKSKIKQMHDKNEDPYFKENELKIRKIIADLDKVEINFTVHSYKIKEFRIRRHKN